MPRLYPCNETTSLAPRVYPNSSIPFDTFKGHSLKGHNVILVNLEEGGHCAFLYIKELNDIAKLLRHMGAETVLTIVPEKQDEVDLWLRNCVQDCEVPVIADDGALFARSLGLAEKASLEKEDDAYRIKPYAMLVDSGKIVWMQKIKFNKPIGPNGSPSDLIMQLGIKTGLVKK